MIKKFLLTAITLIIAASAMAQDSSSSSSVVRRRAGSERGAKDATPGVSQRMQSHLDASGTDDSELQWMRVMYRELDLTKDENGALYYPDEPVEGQDNLFRIIMRQMADGKLGAYEYLDGREVFNDNFRVKMRDVLDRFHILYSEAKGSTEKNPRFTIEEADVPASEVLSYYVIEKWEFDKRTNRMQGGRFRWRGYPLSHVLGALQRPASLALNPEHLHRRRQQPPHLHIRRFLPARAL